MPNNKVKAVELIFTGLTTKQKRPDYLAVEAPLEIRLGHDKDHFQTLSVTLCSPEDIDALITGYLFTEQIIKAEQDVLAVNLFENELGFVAEVLLNSAIEIESFINKRHGMVHASCGICGKSGFDDLLVFNYPVVKESGLEVTATTILALPEAIDQFQTAFTQTGGLHASALFTPSGKLVYLLEDIGRHNALDKLIGTCLINGQSMTDHIVFLSGRISFELTHKALVSGANLLVAIGAPSSLSVELAENNGMTMVGFVKPDKFNIYTNIHRVNV